ncbi:MAG: hypothetical protein ACREBW_03520, partial [Candidatus Micrarchaeaceae archaeon]
STMKDRSDAFEVSDDGHSIVLQTMGPNDTGHVTSRQPIFGARYKDNTISAWGNIPIMGPGNTLHAPTGSFGVDSVQCVAGGQYNIFIHLVDDHKNLVVLNAGAVTATVVGNVCDFATTSTIIGNMFSVYIHKMGSQCGSGDYQPFMFQLCGKVN